MNVEHLGTIVVLVGMLIGSLWVGQLAQRMIEKRSFLEGFFLGNRGLGSWALALTATVQSGGTFIGFPGLVYKHGWIVSLWIAGYMAVPITGFGILAKRLAMLSRRTNAITVPDLFRERFQSPMLATMCSLLIIFHLGFMMVAQFKGGAIILQQAWFGSEVPKLPPGAINWPFITGLLIFSFVVIGYTLMGGFLAAVWTDLFQSILMLIGVLVLLPLALHAAGGLEQASQQAIANTSPSFSAGPGFSTTEHEFMPIGLAVSFFFVWVFAGIGSPASMARYMACRDTITIRRSIILFGTYNLLIYLPLIVICICARAIIPNLQDADLAMPTMTMKVTKPIWGGGVLAGIILSAPFGAVMATVSGYLVVIASAFVKDIYVGLIDRNASENRLRWASRCSILLIGMIAVLANLWGIDSLQAIVIFNNESQAATFVVPVVMLAFWRRATVHGALASMLTGFLTVLILFVFGWINNALEQGQHIGMESRFRPHYLLTVSPVVWGLVASTIAGITASMLTKPPSQAQVDRLFE